MTIDEAIKHCEEKAEEQEYVSQIIVELHHEKSEREHKAACDECAADHRQLAEWLMELKDLRAEQNEQYVFIHELMSELKEAKRLLKAAVEDANAEAESLCAFCKHNDLVDGCPYIESYSECEYIWRYTDEALKLIGKEGEQK